MRKLILIAALAVASLYANAQTAQSVFFLKNDPSINRLNPALGDTAAFVGCGGIEYASRGNVGLSSFLYPNTTGAGGIVTGLHSSISTEQLMSNLKEDNFRNSKIFYNLFSYGKMSHGAYQTIEANVRSDQWWSLPKEMFHLLKTGTSQSDYDLSGFNVNANLYSELVYGYKRQINSWLTLGARAKLYAGFTNANYTIEQLDIHLAEDEYTMTTKARLKAATPIGLGAGLDLGAAITPIKGLEVSLAVNNIGAIRWKFSKVGESSGTTTYDGFDEYNIMPNDLKKFNETMQKTISDVKGAFKIQNADPVKEFQAVPFNVNAGVKYRLPMYDKVSVGAIAHYENGVYDNYVEARAGAGIDIWGWLNCAINAGACNYNAIYGISTTFLIKKHFRLNFSTEGPFSKYIPTHQLIMPVIPVPLEAYSTSTTFSIVYML